MEAQGYPMVRFADDFVILCPSYAQAEKALEEVQRVCQKQGITLHPTKTKIVDMTDRNAGFDFLGYHFRHTPKGKITKWPRPSSQQKLRAKIKMLTKRTNGQSLQAIIDQLNRVLSGWYRYFRFSRKGSFELLDASKCPPYPDQ